MNLMMANIVTWIEILLKFPETWSRFTKGLKTYQESSVNILSLTHLKRNLGLKKQGKGVEFPMPRILLPRPFSLYLSYRIPFHLSFSR